ICHSGELCLAANAIKSNCVLTVGRQPFNQLSLSALLSATRVHATTGATPQLMDRSLLTLMNCSLLACTLSCAAKVSLERVILLRPAHHRPLESSRFNSRGTAVDCTWRRPVSAGDSPPLVAAASSTQIQAL